ncbi:MAG: MarC family protein [Deltaproteobacteria bacterium HGW-Deltaproteobacteria-4]|nr:MAG: MarC family protein [Deltaproteobacteria bacterium HGW-Deltaproteobacteria-4]
MPAEIFLHALTSYFVIIDPIGSALIFHSLTIGGSRSYARRMALRAVGISTLIILLFGFFGEALLAKLGISIAALRVSGGLLLFFTAFQMITRAKSDERNFNSDEIDISVFPMSIPLISGPGCLTLTILLFSRPAAQHETLALLAAVLTISVITLLALLLAPRVTRIIGRTGDDILRRLLGVILAALSIQFVADGIRQIVTN